MLYAINHDLKTNLWCGIAALATLTGEPTSVCRDIIRAVRNGRALVKGITNAEMQYALERLGYRTIGLNLELPRPTLARWLRSRTGQLLSDTLLVNVTGHYVVIEGKRFIDNQNREPVFIRSAPRRRARVKRVWIIQRKGG